MLAMYISSDKPINFTKFDNYCLYLDEMLEHVPEMKSRRTRAQFAAHARNIVGKIWNLGHGTDLDELCDGKRPSPLDGEC
jgi:hypothetical protein